VDAQQLLCSGEGRAILGARANALLIVGAAIPQDELLRMLAARLAPPVHTVLGWPSNGVPQEGTLIIRNVERLSTYEQFAMLTWLMDTRRSVQTIALCAEPLFPLVARDEFLPELYYRLNTIYVRLDGP
jgi:hypothetical protein